TRCDEYRLGLARIRDRALPAPAEVDPAGADGTVAGVDAGAGADPVRVRRAAGLAGRSTGGPAGAARAFAQRGRGPGVRPDDPAADPGPADPGAAAGAPGQDPDLHLAAIPRLVRGNRAAMGGSAHRAGPAGVAGSGPPGGLDPRPLAPGRWICRHPVRLPVALGLRDGRLGRQRGPAADPHVLFPA